MRSLLVFALASATSVLGCLPADPSAPPDGGAPSDGGLDAPADANPPNEGGSPDAAAPDGGDAASDAGALVDPNRIIHLADTPPTIDLCYSTSTTFTGSPILKTLGLPAVPSGGVSAPFKPPPDAVGSGIYFRVVDGSKGDCSTSVFDGFGPVLDLGPRKIFVYQGDGSQVTSIGQPLNTAPGKDAVFNLQRLPNRSVNYVQGASTPIAANNFNGALIPAGGIGSIVTSLPPSPDVTRPYKPVAGGLTLLLVLPDKTLACDLLAPPVAGFTVCSTQIRAN